jgi:hypothetical protein
VKVQELVPKWIGDGSTLPGAIIPPFGMGQNTRINGRPGARLNAVPLGAKKGQRGPNDANLWSGN